MPNSRAIGLFSGAFNMQNIFNSDWKTIPEFPKYAITSDGQVWSYYTNRFLKLFQDRHGYSVVSLYNDLGQSTHLVHRLVGRVFVKLPKEFNGNYDIATINHIDHNKKNNHYTNLEWVSLSYNSKEPWDNGYMEHMKKKCFCVSIEDKKYTPFDSLSDMVQSLNLPIGSVSTAINRDNGIIQGKYIVGYTKNLDEKYLLPKPDVDGIIQLYSKAIANYKPNKTECFCVSIEDEKFTKRDSANDMDRSLNLPEGTVSKAISRANGILQGKYIVGYTEDLDQRYLSPAPDAVGIIQLYSDAIANYKSNKIECFLIDSSDNSYEPFDSYAAIDKYLNLPIGTANQAIHKTHGLIRGRYIAGAINDIRWKKILPKCTVEQIVASYAKQIERYKQRGPRKITNLETGESETYDSLSDFAREQRLDPRNIGQYLKNHPDLYKVELA